MKDNKNDFFSIAANLPKEDYEKMISELKSNGSLKTLEAIEYARAARTLEK